MEKMITSHQSVIRKVIIWSRQCCRSVTWQHIRAGQRFGWWREDICRAEEVAEWDLKAQQQSQFASNSSLTNYQIFCSSITPTQWEIPPLSTSSVLPTLVKCPWSRSANSMGRSTPLTKSPLLLPKSRLQRNGGVLPVGLRPSGRTRLSKSAPREETSKSNTQATP